MFRHRDRARTFQHNFRLAAFLLYFIVSFLFGSFISNCLTEYCTLKDSSNTHHAAVFLELGLLLAIGIWSGPIISKGLHKELVACLLLFSMGSQNTLVSKISQATVRTTHLTGLFTDLGIELSQLIFYKEKSKLLN